MSDRSRRPDWQIIGGDALELLRTLHAESVDAVVTDPPYALGLRGATWDTPTLDRANRRPSPGTNRFAEWTTEWARQCLRVLKPGGYLLAFGAPRTAHRLASGVEDAGFELRDQLVWLFAGGVPKDRLRDRRSSTLKPAYEPIILARKPLAGTLDENERRFGTGRLGIDDARVPSADRAGGRWPCNVSIGHEPACAQGACAVHCAAAVVDRSRPRVRPSRFYYCAKASRRERDAGCRTLPAQRMRIYGNKNTAPRRNTHPTVKPVALMRWLIRLGCQPGGLVLDPFAGSGSTGVATLQEHRRFIGIEREPDYARIARARLEHAVRELDGRTVDATQVGVVSAAPSSSLSKGGSEP